MASVIEKRLSLHQRLTEQQRENDALQSRITQLQALASLGNASYMIAHEINNLLTPVRSYAALALKNPDDKSLAQKVLQKTARNCECASKIMESMLALANGETQKKENTRLITLVEDVFACLARNFTKDNITVKIEIDKDLSVYVVPVQIQQVFMNLILNARDAMLPHGGTLSIRAEEKNDAVEIEVADTGCGIEPADLANIFDSFFTTKTKEKSSSQHSGSGLGLAFCRKVINAHNGLISVDSEPARGTTFKISLPKGEMLNTKSIP